MEFRDSIKNLCLLEPVYENNGAAVVFISNQDKLGETVTTISSMVEQSSEKNKWDIIV